MTSNATHMQKLVRDYASPGFVKLRGEMTVDEALKLIREQHPEAQSLVYFYVVEPDGKLAGVLKTRALLTARPEEKLRDLMVARVIAIPETATLLDACEFFVLHKFLAFPVVDSQRRIVGTVDISLFNEEVFGIPKTERPSDMFQAIGFHISQVRHASPLSVLRIRFPWLLVTISAGTACAFLAHAHEATLKNTLVVALFLALVLALGESVAVQSMAFVLETLRLRALTWRLAARSCSRSSGRWAVSCGRRR
jgi:magnesium transporter